MNHFNHSPKLENFLSLFLAFLAAAGWIESRNRANEEACCHLAYDQAVPEVVASKVAELATTNSADLTSFLIQPDVRGERIVFVSGEDIWATAKDEQWVARNLTDSVGGELNPKLSHDGQWVAYNHPVDGVFVVPFEGGTPKQLTFKGNRGSVVGWTVDGRIAYTGYESAPFPDAMGLSFVRLTGGQPEHTGIAEVGYAWFNPNGVDMIYSKSAISTGTHARFHGGTANQILRLNLANGKYDNIFPSRCSRHAAVNCQGNAYFIGTESDAALNLWTVNDKGPAKLTQFSIDGVRNLASDGEKMLFEQGGSLFWFDPKTRQVEQVPIRLKGLPDAPTKKRFEVGDSVNEVDPTTSGQDVAIVSRGEVFVSSEGRLQNISNHSGANDTGAVWSKDEKRLAFISDCSGENAIYLWERVSKQTRMLTTCSRMPDWIEWSPGDDGLFYLLDRESVHWVHASSGRDQQIGKVDRWVTSHSASPDGRFLAITAAQENKRTSVVLIDRTTQQSYRATDPRFIDTSCVFDSRENVLYFLSRRNGRPNLTQELPDLNLSGGMSLARIDLRDPAFLSPTCDFRSRTRWIDSEGKDLDTLSNHPDGAVVSGTDGNYLLDRSTMRFKQMSAAPQEQLFNSPYGSSRASIDAGSVKVETWNNAWKPTAKFNLDTSFEIDLKKEWESMYWAVHRFHRDQFYDRNMLGVDWTAVGQHYSKYLPRVRSRNDLTLLMARMTGELPGGHNGVTGDPKATLPQARPKAPETGLIVGWENSGAKILRVLRGRTDMQMFGSLESGVEGVVEEGQYIRSVNGKPITATVGFDELTVGIAATDIVTLEVSETAHGPSKKVEVRFLNNFLGYSDFLDRTIDRVSQQSNGRIGYAHMFDTFSQGGGTFSDGFNSQWHLDGFLLDARWNRGGNSNPGFIDAMQAKPLFVEVKRFGEPTMDTGSMKGPIAMLVNRETVSGGDLLACAFRSRKVGSLVGDRTSGRTIGNQWFGQLIDGSTVRTSESHNLDWSTQKDAGENVGVQPDVEVELIPKLKFSVQDEQLDRAIEVLLSKAWSQNRTEVEDWLQKSAIPFDDSTVDFGSMEEAFRKARVIALGEATHGQHEVFEIKRQLTMHLIREHGTRLVAYEASASKMLAVADYVSGKSADKEKAMSGFGMLIWEIEENMALLDDLRQWNRNAGPQDQVRLIGIDAQDVDSAMKRLLQLIGNDPLEIVAKIRALVLKAKKSIAELMAGNRANWDEIAKEIESVRTQLLSLQTIDTVHASEYSLRVHEFLSSLSIYATLGGRDQAMAELLLEQLNQAGNESRCVVWAHNGHIQRCPLHYLGSQELAAGGHLAKQLGDHYYALGVAFGEGEFQANAPALDGSWGFRRYRLSPAPEGSLEWTLGKAGHKQFMVDLRGAPQALAVQDWLRTPHGQRWFGGYSVSDDCDAMTRDASALLPTTPREDFDGLLYVAKTTAAKPIKLQLILNER